MGNFSGPTVAFGQPLSTIQPLDNRFPRFDPLLMSDPDVSAKDREDLQRQIDEVAAALELAQQYGFVP